jgi:hypothetical protein
VLQNVTRCVFSLQTRLQSCFGGASYFAPECFGLALAVRSGRALLFRAARLLQPAMSKVGTEVPWFWSQGDVREMQARGC